MFDLRIDLPERIADLVKYRAHVIERYEGVLVHNGTVPFMDIKLAEIDYQLSVHRKTLEMALERA